MDTRWIAEIGPADAAHRQHGEALGAGLEDVPRQISRRQAPVDSARRVLLPRRAEPCPEGREGFVELRRRAADQLLERRRPPDDDEAVPEAARRFEALGDRSRRLL